MSLHGSGNEVGRLFGTDHQLRWRGWTHEVPATVHRRRIGQLSTTSLRVGARVGAARSRRPPQRCRCVAGTVCARRRVRTDAQRARPAEDRASQRLAAPVDRGEPDRRRGTSVGGDHAWSHAAGSRLPADTERTAGRSSPSSSRRRSRTPSRERRERLAEEQAALRRVAVLCRAAAARARSSRPSSPSRSRLRPRPGDARRCTSSRRRHGDDDRRSWRAAT